MYINPKSNTWGNENKKSHYNLIPAGLLALFIVGYSASLAAQEDTSDNLAWLDYFDLQLNVKQSENSIVSREGQKLAVKAEVPVGESLFFASVATLNEDSSIESVLSSDARFECGRDPEGNSHDFSCEPTSVVNVNVEQDLEFEELGYRLFVSDAIEVTFGLFAQPWGQFQLISPVNFLLPQDFETSSIGLTKATLQLEQEQVSGKFFITDRLELQLMSTASLRIAPSLLQVIADEHEVDSDVVGDYLLDGKSITALRFLMYPDWGIVGFTYFDGYQQFVSSPYRVVREMNGDEIAFRRRSIDPDDPRSLDYGELYPLTGYGVEFSVGVGNGWSLLGEVVLTETQGTLDFRDSPPLDPSLTDDPFTMRQIAFYQAIIDRGMRYNISDVEQMFISIGFEKINLDPTGWSYSYQFLSFSESYTSSDWGEIENLYVQIGNEVPDNSGFLPAIYLFNRHNVFNRPATFTFATGAFGNVFGLTALWGVQVTDYLTLEVGLEALDNVSNEDAVEGASNRNYEYDGGGFQPGYSFGFALSF